MKADIFNMLSATEWRKRLEAWLDEKQACKGYAGGWGGNYGDDE